MGHCLTRGVWVTSQRQYSLPTELFFKSRWFVCKTWSLLSCRKCYARSQKVPQTQTCPIRRIVFILPHRQHLMLTTDTPCFWAWPTKAPDTYKACRCASRNDSHPTQSYQQICYVARIRLQPLSEWSRKRKSSSHNNTLAQTASSSPARTLRCGIVLKLKK